MGGCECLSGHAVALALCMRALQFSRDSFCDGLFLILVMC